jgi:hypothetical protein
LCICLLYVVSIKKMHGKLSFKISYTNSVFTSQSAQFIYIIKTDWLVLFREIIAYVFWEQREKCE